MGSVKRFLKSVEGFYQPENPKAKTGIGHEVEHLKGVIMRSHQILGIVKNKTEQDISAELVTSVAVFHDIGNVINRDCHNHIAYGIVMGKLTPEDILSVPMDIKNKPAFLTEQEKKKILAFMDYHKTEIGYDLSSYKSELTNREITGLKNIVKNLSAFEAGYNGISANQFEDYICKQYNLPLTDDQIIGFVMDEFIRFIPEDSKNTRLNRNMIPEYKDLNINKADELQELTTKMHAEYTTEQLKILAEAVQDHNIDWTMDEQGNNIRYEARSIYGMIVADADKDNVAETFGLRTLAFAVNKWALEMKKSYYLITANVPDLIKCSTHIMHQANERFRDVFDPNAGKPEMDIDLSIFEYKNNPDKIKCIKAVTDKEAKEYEVQGHKIYTIPPRDPSTWYTLKDDNGKEVIGEDGKPVIVKDYLDKNGQPLTGQKYIVRFEAGDDCYSQIDNKFGGKDILSLRSEFFKKVREWADPSPENVEKVMKELTEGDNSVLSIYIKSESIEEACNRVELNFWLKNDPEFLEKFLNQLENSTDEASRELASQFRAEYEEIMDEYDSGDKLNKLIDELSVDAKTREIDKNIDWSGVMDFTTPNTDDEPTLD